MKHSVIAKTLGTLALLSLSSLAAAQILNINAFTNGRDTDYPGSNNPITLTVGPGTYLFEHVDSSHTMGAYYTAWNAWGNTSGCGSNGACSGNGWLGFVRFDTGAGTEERVFGDFTKWATPQLAFAHSQTLPEYRISFDKQTTIRFNLADSYHWDNLGGISVRVSAVPEPETYAMMLAGLGGLALAARRRRVNAKLLG